MYALKQYSLLIFLPHDIKEEVGCEAISVHRMANFFLSSYIIPSNNIECSSVYYKVEIRVTIW